MLSLLLMHSSRDGRQDAVIYIQRFYRHYRRITIWQSMGDQMLVVARCNLEDQRTMEETELTVANFRMLLMQGFSAHKVSISGVLKTIHLNLVLKEQSQDCYLTWTPSRKRHPRIHLRTSALVAAIDRSYNHGLTCDAMLFR